MRCEGGAGAFVGVENFDGEDVAVGLVGYGKRVVAGLDGAGVVGFEKVNWAGVVEVEGGYNSAALVGMAQKIGRYEDMS